MRISLVQISLLRFLKTFPKYLPYAILELFTSLVQLFWANAIFWLLISLLGTALS